MGRPPLAVGTAGDIMTRRDGDRWKARQYVRDPDGRRREVARWASTEAAAKAAVRRALRDRVAPDGSSGEITADTRLAVVAARWIADVDASGRAANTKTLYRSALENHVLPAMGGLLVREVSVTRVDAALRTIRAHSGPGTAKSVRSVLSGVLDDAARYGALPANPVRSLGRTRGPDKQPVRALTLAEEDRVRDAPRSSQRAVDLDVPDLIDWMLGTGMRIGEACAIRDRGLDGRLLLDLDAGTVEINATVVRVKGVGLLVQERPKTAAGWRVLALPEDLVAMLRRRRGELRLDPPETLGVLDGGGAVHRGVPGLGLVFWSPRGQLRDPSNTAGDLREVFDAIDRPDGAEESGPLGWVHSHVFRKTVATRLDAAGFSAREIADILGHRHPSMTMDFYMGRQVVSARAASALARPVAARP